MSKPPSPQERLADATEALVDLERQNLRERQRDARARREEERRREEMRPGHRRPDLYKIPFLAYASAAPLLAEAFSRKIPPEFWSVDTDTALVSCPCGELATTELGIPSFCGGSDWVDEDRPRDDEKDGCGRAYLYDGMAVRVAFSPAPAKVA